MQATKSRKPYRDDFWLLMLSKGIAMPLDDNERNEINKMWERTDENTRQNQANAAEIRVLNTNMANMMEKFSESYGRMSNTLDNLATAVHELGTDLLQIRAERRTVGAIVDRWAPLVLSFFAVGVAVWAVLEKSA